MIRNKSKISLAIGAIAFATVSLTACDLINSPSGLAGAVDPVSGTLTKLNEYKAKPEKDWKFYDVPITNIDYEKKRDDDRFISISMYTSANASVKSIIEATAKLCHVSESKLETNIDSSGYARGGVELETSNAYLTCEFVKPLNDQGSINYVHHPKQ